MSISYAVRPRAERDSDEISEFLADEADLETALSFLTKVHDTFVLLATQQQMGWSCRTRHPLLSGARTFCVSRPFEKYLIFYQPHAGRIEIIRVLHGYRDLEEIFRTEGID